MRSLKRLGTALAIGLPMVLASAALAADGRNEDGIPEQQTVETGKTAAGDRWAVVDGNGVLARGKGVVSTTRQRRGDYIVEFDRNITNCVYVASIGLSGQRGVSPPGMITTVRRNGNPNAVFVSTYDPDGFTANRSFHLFVGCD